MSRKQNHDQQFSLDLDEAPASEVKQPSRAAEMRPAPVDVARPSSPRNDIAESSVLAV